MKKLSRKLFNECIGDEESLKALSLLIFIKQHKMTSVVANYSYYKLAKMTGMHKNTIKKRINTLGDMDLIDLADYKCQNIRFKKVRAKKSNVDISKIDKSSVKSIELGLKAILLVEIQKQKNFIEQLVVKATNPDSKTTLDEVKNAKKICRQRGITKFDDKGISYKTLAKKMKVGYGKVSQVIEYGIKRRMFFKQRNIKAIYKNVSNPKALLNTIDCRNVFYSRYSNSIYQCYANTYTLLA